MVVVVEGSVDWVHLCIARDAAILVERARLALEGVRVPRRRRLEPNPPPGSLIRTGADWSIRIRFVLVRNVTVWCVVVCDRVRD